MSLPLQKPISLPCTSCSVMFDLKWNNKEASYSLYSFLCHTVTHVVVDDSMGCDRALSLLKVDRLPSGVYLLKCTWLSTCISEQRLLDTADYSLIDPDKDMETTKDGVKEDVLNKIPLLATQDMKQPISDETKPDESTETLG